MTDKPEFDLDWIIGGREIPPEAYCTAPGCQRMVSKKGLCENHYHRMWKYGRLEKVYDGRSDHPLYRLWSKQKRRFCPEWQEDFLLFAEQVSPFPEGDHRDRRLWKLRQDEPLGPNNFTWKKMLKRRPDEAEDEWMLRKWHNNPSNNTPANLNRNLKRYGITVADYDAMLEDQNGVCACCYEPEIARDNSTGKVRRLSVDHCHTTGRVRGLLCTRCNQTIGLVEESTVLLEKIADYIERHNGQSLDANESAQAFLSLPN